MGHMSILVYLTLSDFSEQQRGFGSSQSIRKDYQRPWISGNAYSHACGSPTGKGLPSRHGCSESTKSRLVIACRESKRSHENGLHVSRPVAALTAEKRSDRRQVSQRTAPFALPECLGLERPKGLGVKVGCATIRRVLIVLIYEYVQRMVRQSGACSVVIDTFVCSLRHVSLANQVLVVLSLSCGPLGFFLGEEVLPI